MWNDMEFLLELQDEQFNNIKSMIAETMGYTGYTLEEIKIARGQQKKSNKVIYPIILKLKKQEFQHFDYLSFSDR